MQSLIDPSILQRHVAAMQPVGKHIWRLVDGKLCITLAFADFHQAFEFMTVVAQDAEALNHHPEWSNTYNRVSIALTTHDALGITALDLALAERITTAANRWLGNPLKGL